MGKRQEIVDAIRQLEAQRAILGDIAVEAALEGLRHRLAEIDGEQLSIGGERRQGERRVVTMLFSDVRGSTAAASRLDPEDWSQVMNGVFKHMIRPVEKYEGTIARLMGDAILAFFGAPTAHESDPQRAVLAGLEIVAGVQPYRQEVKDQWGIDIDLRVGINTGMVLVGDVGSDGHLEYTAMGDAINIAARMEQTASPGTVQITEDTHKLVAPMFEFKDLGGVQVKGQPEPIHSYQVLAPKVQPRRLRGLQGYGIHSPLVGREQELAAADAALQSLFDGQGRILFVNGEAGLGKSRLIAELKSSIPNQPAKFLWLEGHALSFGQTISYWPFQEILRHFAGISEEETDYQAWERLETGIVGLFGEDANEILPYLASMLSLEVRGEYAERVKYLDAEAMGQQVFLAIRRFFEQLASRQPLVLFFDDLHWLDESSAKLIEHLLPLVQKQPILLAVTSRPEPDTPAAELREVVKAGYAHVYIELQMKPLTPGDSDQLVHNLLDIENLPISLRRSITHKADGNPFFVEEIIRSLIDGGAIVWEQVSERWQAMPGIQDLTIPDTLQGVIMARIDRLDEGVRRVLGAAAVIGRTFLYRVLKMVETTGEALDENLEQLQQIELISELRHTTELEYIFRHALAQEVVYENLLRQRQRELHARVGLAIEQLFADRIEEFYGLLAYHYSRAEVWEKAQDYLFKAGDQAGGIAADKEALISYQKALEAYEFVYGTRWDPVQHADIERKIGQTLMRLGDHAGSIPHYEQAFDLLGRKAPATKWGVRWNIVGAIFRQVGHRLFPGLFIPENKLPLTQAETVEMLINRDLVWALAFIDLERTAAVLLGAFNLGEKRQDPFWIVMGAYGVGGIISALGRLNMADHYYQLARATAEILQNPVLNGELHFMMAQHELQSGDLDAVRHHAEKGLIESHKSGDIRSLGWNTKYLGYSAFYRGDFETGVLSFKKLCNLGENVGSVQLQILGRLDLGWTQLFLGDFKEAVVNLRAAFEMSEQVPDYNQLAVSGAVLAQTYLMTGQLSLAYHVLISIDELTRHKVPSVYNQTILMTIKALFALTAVEHPGAFDEADNQSTETWLKRAGSACRRSLRLSKGSRVHLPMALRLQGTYDLLNGKLEAARRCWEESLALAVDMGLRPQEALTRFEIGKRTQDWEMLEASAGMFDEMGMAHYLSLAKKAMRDLD